jgi:hypothetical protein
MDHIRYEMIHFIEEALDITLYVNQIKYLTGDISEPNYDDLRGTGKTTAYCIKLALSSGSPLDSRDTTEFSDAQYSGLTGSNASSYSKHFFLREFTSIREKLLNNGFPVRELRYSKRTGGIVVGD